MYTSTTRLCTKALIQKMTELQLPMHCTVADTTIEYALIEKKSKQHGSTFTISKYGWLAELKSVVKKYAKKICKKGLQVVVPFMSVWYFLDGSDVGHAIIGVLSGLEDGNISLQIYDANGFDPDMQKPFMRHIQRYFSDESPKVIPAIDESLPDMNSGQRKSVKGHLAKVGIKYKDVDGLCAFLAFVYTLDQLCTGLSSEGHGLRLFQDLLLREDEIQKMTSWEEAIVSAYAMACAFRMIEIMLEFYPDKETAVKHGWDSRIDFPDLRNVQLIRVGKRLSSGVLKLQRQK